MLIRSKHWHMLNYIMVSHSDVDKVRNTRAMRGADCMMDHVIARCRSDHEKAAT